MSDTPNLNLPYMLAAQAQKHVTHNEALRMLDTVVQMSVLDRHLATPPGSPANGDCYIVAASPTGAWAGQAAKIAAFQDGAWAFYAPKEGWLTWIADENVVAVFDGSGWALLPSGGGGGGGTADHGLLTGLADDDHPQYHNNARGDARYTPLAPALLGINATADTTNRLAVASAASLFNHAGGDHQVKINKNVAANTASCLFQTGFSGRAEFGTTGDDNFHLKVSPNGSTFYEAFVIDRSSGRIGIGGVINPSENLENGGYFYANGENSGVVVDASGQKRFGFVKISGSATEIRHSAALSIRSVSTGSIFAPTASVVSISATTGGLVGIGMTGAAYQLQVASDSAAKPSTNTWTVASDERLKENIVPADLERCWQIVREVPLKRYTWKADAYTRDQVADRSKLGWIAQDVQPYFGNAVLPHVFQCPPVADGDEVYEEQDSIVRIVERDEEAIEVRDGKAVLVKKRVATEQSEPVFDLVEVVDEHGEIVVRPDGAPLTHAVPRMVSKTRPKTRTDTIDDCLSLNSDQLYAAMYGALQLAMQKIEALEGDVAELRRGRAPAL